MIERVAYRPLRNAPKLAPLITAVGMSFILQNVGILWLGGSQKGIPDLIDAQKSSSSTSRGVDHLAAPTCWPWRSPSRWCFLLTAFVNRSRLGKAMRATAQDPEAARLMGINVDTTISLTFLLGGLLAGAAGLIYALYQTQVWFFQGFTAGLIAFTAAVMGGIGNLRGAVLGGMIIGVHPADLRQPDRQRVDPRRRVRLPRADHGLPPAGPDRRGDPGGRMSAAARAPPGSRGPTGCPRSSCCVAVALFPIFRPPLDGFMDDCDPGAGLRGHGARAEHRRRLRRPARPGLRGLLRLRRARPWAGSPPTTSRASGATRASTSASASSPSSLPGIHLNFLLIVIARDRHLCGRGGDHRPAHAAPARRLHRDRHAGLRRDHRPRRRRTATRSRSAATRFSNGRQSISPIDQIDLPFFGEFDQRHQPQTVLLDRPGAGARGAVRELPPARLAPGPGLDRPARGRGGGRQHGRAAGKTKLMAYAVGAAFGGISGRVPRRVPATA